MISACTAKVSPFKSPIPEQGLTVSQIYHGQVAQTVQQTPRYAFKKMPQSGLYEGYTRMAMNETKMLFKPLDNPQVPIYVYPHVALIGDEQLIKPGYTTAFFLYKQNQFALASERY